MANNCLVTKLKGVVNNDELLKIGEVKMRVTVDGDITATIFPNSVEFKKNGVDISGRNQYGTVTFSALAGDILSITPKYDLRSLSICGNLINDPGFENVSLLELAITKAEGITQETVDKLASLASIGDQFIIGSSRELDGLSFNGFASIPVKKIGVSFNAAILNLLDFAANNPTLESYIDGGSSPRELLDWPANTRPSGYPIIAIHAAGNTPVYWNAAAITGFLNNMASCQVPAEPIGAKEIVLRNRDGQPLGDVTSAVATLKSNGYRIVIDGSEL